MVGSYLLESLDGGSAAFITPGSVRVSSLSRRSEATASDVHRKIRAAFEAFDYESNNTADVR